MPESISPAFVQIDYHSAFGVHTQRIPVSNINVNTPASTTTVECWDLSTIVWRTMVNALVTEMLPQMPNTVVFDTATLFYVPGVDSPPVFVDSYSLTAMVGSAVGPGWSKAVQHTIVARDVDGNIAKIVLLDAGSGDDFDPESDPVAAGYDGLLDEWFAETNGWMSRGNARPAVFIKGYKTLNEKLRREYRMG